ncbi:MAG: DUF302 domain-containing protein [Bacillota bacterium]
MTVEVAYMATSEKSFDTVVEECSAKIAEKGFRVLHIHDVQASLAEKGFQREPYKIIELCNARYAHQVLQKDSMIGLMMPCKINVYLENGKTVLNALRPIVLARFFPEAELDQVAREVDQIVCGIVDEVK